MLKKLAFVLLSGVLFLSVYGASHAVRSAQMVIPPMRCFTSATATKGLNDLFKEERLFTALSTTGMQVQIWASPRGKTWTLLYRTPSDVSCLVDYGTNAVFLRRK